MTDYRTDTASAFVRYRRSLESGRVQAATEAAVTVGDSEAPIEGLYVDFVTALEADDLALARALLDTLANRYEEVEGAEQAFLRRVVTGLDANAYEADDRESLLEFSRTMSQANAQRTGFLLEAVSAFESDGPIDTGRLADRATETREIEGSLDSTRQSTASVVSDATVPSTPSIVTVDSPESLAQSETVTITATVENIGDEATLPLDLHISTDSGLVADREGVGLGRLAAREQLSIEIGITGRSPGEHATTVEITADGETVESTVATFTVLETDRSVREVIAGGQDATPSVLDVRAALEYWSQNRQVPETGGETIDDRTLLSLIEEWRVAEGSES